MECRYFGDKELNTVVGRGEVTGPNVEHFIQLIALWLNSRLNFGKVLQARARTGLGWVVVSRQNYDAHVPCKA